MFDKAIIDTDRFMDLSMSSKALYFLLGMEADDEGFVSYKKVMRIHGGNEDDVKVLIAKNFLIIFESGVVVITDWNSNNYLDKNRIKGTEYQKEKDLLILTEKEKYQLNTCSTSIEESRVEQSSIEKAKNKKNLEEKYIIHFENIWDLYSFKKNKKKALSKFMLVMKREKEPFLIIQKIKDSVPDYLKELDNKTWLQQQQLEFWLNGSRWEDEYEVEEESQGIVNLDLIK